ALPVNAFALPLLTTRTRAVPPGSCRRHQSTGAEGALDLVKTPATWVPGAMTTNKRSLRSRYLMPAWPVASLTPASGGRLAGALGASGDFKFPSAAGFEGAAFPFGAPFFAAACNFALVLVPSCIAMALRLPDDSAPSFRRRGLGPSCAN